MPPRKLIRRGPFAGCLASALVVSGISPRGSSHRNWRKGLAARRWSQTTGPAPVASSPPNPWRDRSPTGAALGIGREVLVQASCHGYDNGAMLDAIAAGPAHCRGVAMVEMDVPDNELDALHDAGVRAIRLNFVRHLAQRPELPEASRIVGRITECGWHVELHPDGCA